MVYDVIGIGNTVLDMTVNVRDNFLKAHSLPKGTMILVDETQQQEILASLKDKSISINAGGSVSNTLAAVSSLGGKALFLGSIGEDEGGSSYKEKINVVGVEDNFKVVSVPQGKCVVMITPDNERTFATYLGAGLEFDENSFNEETITNAKILHIEAYQLDGEKQIKAIMKAMRIAKEKSVLVSVDLADPALIQRHRDQLTKIVKDYVDIVFANETEAEEFTSKKPIEAVKELASYCKIAIVKIGSEGSLIMSGENVHTIKGFKMNVVNTNGAGDTFAGSFLKSYIDGKPLAEAGLIASYLAAKVVASESARLEENMVEVVENFLSQ